MRRKSHEVYARSKAIKVINLNLLEILILRWPWGI